MRRILMALMIAAVALVVVPISPAMAQDFQEEQAAESIVYFPYGNGGTYSCTGGPPFVSDSAGTGNCSIEQIGAPTGLTCDIPTNLTFVHEGHEWVSDASLCYYSDLSYYQAEEIAVTGVVSYEGTKADGTPLYGITDETTLGKEWYQQEGYLMEGDYSAYVGKRVTVHGILKSGYVERVLEVTWIE